MRYKYEVWRFVTPIFLHANLVHLLSNIATQLMIGSSLEADIGPKNFLILYLACG